jgi:hypothetical protein
MKQRICDIFCSECEDMWEIQIRIKKKILIFLELFDGFLFKVASYISMSKFIQLSINILSAQIPSSALFIHKKLISDSSFKHAATLSPENQKAARRRNSFWVYSLFFCGKQW